MKRMFVNQPSTAQQFHALHGRNVLAVHEYDDTYRCYFTSGDVVSMQIFGLALSEGWTPHGHSAESVAAYYGRISPQT